MIQLNSYRKIAIIFALWVGLATPQRAKAGILAQLDPISTIMPAEPVELASLLKVDDHRYFERAIPRQIYLVNLCPDKEAQRLWRAAWQDYGQQFGYKVISLTNKHALE